MVNAIKKKLREPEKKGHANLLTAGKGKDSAYHKTDTQATVKTKLINKKLSEERRAWRRTYRREEKNSYEKSRGKRFGGRLAKMGP